MKSIRFIFLIATAFAGTLHAANSLSFDVENNPRYHVEITLPEQYILTLDEDKEDIEVRKIDDTVMGGIGFSIGEPETFEWPKIFDAIPPDHFSIPNLPNATLDKSITMSAVNNPSFVTSIVRLKAGSYECTINLNCSSGLKDLEDVCQLIADGLKLTVSEE
jgi:hypothetical protein